MFFGVVFYVAAWKIISPFLLFKFSAKFMEDALFLAESAVSVFSNLYWWIKEKGRVSFRLRIEKHCGSWVELSWVRLLAVRVGLWFTWNDLNCLSKLLYIWIESGLIRVNPNLIRWLIKPKLNRTLCLVNFQIPWAWFYWHKIEFTSKNYKLLELGSISNQ